MQQEKVYPNLTLDGARDLIAKFQQQADNYKQTTIDVRSRLYEFLFPERKTSTMDSLKSEVVYFHDELDKAIKQRDLLKARCSVLEGEKRVLLLKMKEKGVSDT